MSLIIFALFFVLINIVLLKWAEATLVNNHNHGIMSCLSSTITAYADDYDFDEGDPAAKGSTDLLGGPTWARSGTLFYLVDEYGRYQNKFIPDRNILFKNQVRSIPYPIAVGRCFFFLQIFSSNCTFVKLHKSIIFQLKMKS